MTEAAIEIGIKVHIVTRRRFEGDVRRHFAGEVIGISGALHKVLGYAFVFSPGTNEYERRPELRTRILALGQEGFIVNVLPEDVVVASLEYRSMNKRLVVTDGRGFLLEINEFGSMR